MRYEIIIPRPVQRQLDSYLGKSVPEFLHDSPS